MGRWLRMIGIIGMMIALAGCVPQLAHRPGMIVEEEPVTLRIAWWGGEFRNDATIAVIKLYEEMNPHVRIEYEYSSFNEYWKRMAPTQRAMPCPISFRWTFPTCPSTARCSFWRI